MIDYEIKYLRRKLGLSQVEMADILGVSRSLLSLIEMGKRKFSPSSRHKFEELKTESDSPKEETSLTPQELETIKSKSILELEKKLRIYDRALRNLKFDLNKRTEISARAKKSLAVICEEMQIFKGVNRYTQRLEDMHQAALKAYEQHSPEQVQILELKINSLQYLIDETSALLNAWMSK